MNYQNIISKLNVFNEFKQYVNDNKLSQAYLFSCPDRFTNKNLLLLLAKVLLCKNQNACNVCEHCAKVNAGTHPDLLIYPKDKNFVVEDSNNIYETVQVKPMLANKKVYVINDIDNSTEQAQNKLLKIIEEPPQNVIFLFSASNEEKVLSTILSRVFKLRVDKMQAEDLKNILGIVDSQIANVAISFGDGYLGKTLDLINNQKFVENYKNMENLIIKLKRSEQIPYFSGFFAKDKATFQEDLLILNDFFRDILMLKVGENHLVKNNNLIAQFEELLPEFSTLALTIILNKLSLTKKRLDSNVGLTVLADNLLFDILEVKYLCK